MVAVLFELEPGRREEEGRGDLPTDQKGMGLNFRSLARSLVDAFDRGSFFPRRLLDFK